MLRADDALDVLGPIGDAAAVRGDPAWAPALLATTCDPRLLALLPPASATSSWPRGCRATLVKRAPAPRRRDPGGLA